MTKPLLIAVGADKGGVGKTTVARALDDYLRAQREGIVLRAFDTQSPNGDLSRFVKSSIVVDAMNVDDQMHIFDGMRGVTMMDVKGGILSEFLLLMRNMHFLDDVRDGKMNLLLLHVLGPSAASLQEIAHTTDVLGQGVRHVLVKNYVNESGYKEWETDTRFSSTLRSARTIVIPHLAGRVCTEIQIRGVGFADYVANKDGKSSYVVSGLTRTWLASVFEAFDAAGIKELVEESS